MKNIIPLNHGALVIKTNYKLKIKQRENNNSIHYEHNTTDGIGVINVRSSNQ